MNAPKMDSVSGADDPGRISALLGRAIDDIGIPPCPEILVQINAEMGKDEPDLKRLDAIVSSDAGLAAGLIALANSPFFGIRNRVRSAREALMMLGLAVAGRAIAGIVLRKMFPPTPALLRFWDSSARVARVCSWLSQGGRIAPRLRPDEAYTFGLFRDCGIPVLLRRFEQYENVVTQASGESSLAFTAVEESFCTTNHAAVGCLLAQAWWLPDDIALAIRHHHDYSLLDSQAVSPSATSRHLAAAALLAEHLVQTHTGAGLTQEWGKGAAIGLRLLGLDEASVPALLDASAPVVHGET